MVKAAVEMAQNYPGSERAGTRQQINHEQQQKYLAKVFDLEVYRL